MMHDQELLRLNAALYRQFRRTIGALVAQAIRVGLFQRIDPEEAGAVIKGEYRTSPAGANIAERRFYG